MKVNANARSCKVQCPDCGTWYYGLRAAPGDGHIEAQCRSVCFEKAPKNHKVNGIKDEKIAKHFKALPIFFDEERAHGQ